MANTAGLTALVRGFVCVCAMLPEWIIALVARCAAASVFWFSGRTKVDGLFTIRDTTYELFATEYKVPGLPPDIAAVMATVAEHVFPIMLALGLAARFGALALLGMTAVIQIFVYPGAWPTHILWAAALLYVFGRGPGMLSVDHLIARRCQGR